MQKHVLEQVYKWRVWAELCFSPREGEEIVEWMRKVDRVVGTCVALS